MRIYGKIVDEANCPNSYLVKTERGNILRRNRWHLIPAFIESEADRDRDTAPPFVDEEMEDRITVNEEQELRSEGVDSGDKKENSALEIPSNSKYKEPD